MPAAHIRSKYCLASLSFFRRQSPRRRLDRGAGRVDEAFDAVAGRGRGQGGVGDFRKLGEKTGEWGGVYYVDARDRARNR